jgi:hypothetical protein
MEELLELTQSMCFRGDRSLGRDEVMRHGVKTPGVQWRVCILKFHDISVAAQHCVTVLGCMQMIR